MASFAKALPCFFLLVLFSSLQVEARQRLFFSKITHNNGNEPDIPVTEDPETPTPTPSYTPTYSPLYGPTYAPAPELTVADAPLYGPTYAPAPELTVADAPEEGAPLAPAPAPAPSDSEPELGYELYGSADQETPTTMDVQNEVTTQENGRYENTNLYNDNSNYATNYNTDRYTTNYINGREGSTNSYYSNDNGNSVDGFEQQGMSDTRILENGSYYQDDVVKNKNNDEFNGYQSGRGSTTNEVYFGNNEKPNEFNTMEEYEKYQENQGYVP
uniref:protein E6-like n=1 Tax=Fragaria vesca subsp. vesca TaxID=101020 RepID=UPI0005C8FEA4|nr:PREDICTED: protein E6-like [Fragaria vesca subsp. vesca]